mgnify:CR=1 FL=1
MGTIKGIPYGMSNFEDVITQNRYYVDKCISPCWKIKPTI